MDHLCFLFLVFLMLSCLFIAALWSPGGKRLTSWLLLVVFIVFVVTFPCGILGQVWYLIVLIPDLCRLSYFVLKYTIVAQSHFNILVKCVGLKHCTSKTFSEKVR